MKKMEQCNLRDWGKPENRTRGGCRSGAVCIKLPVHVILLIMIKGQTNPKSTLLLQNTWYILSELREQGQNPRPKLQTRLGPDLCALANSMAVIIKPLFGMTLSWHESTNWLALRLGLIHVGGIVIREVVVAPLHPDVLHLPVLIRVCGPAGAQLVVEQGLNLLQPPALCFRQTAVDEEEPKQSQAGVKEKRSWEITITTTTPSTTHHLSVSNRAYSFSLTTVRDLTKKGPEVFLCWQQRSVLVCNSVQFCQTLSSIYCTLLNDSK